MRARDLLPALCGPFRETTSLLSWQYPDILLGDGKGPPRRVTDDHLPAQGRFSGGAPFTVEVAGGREGRTRFRPEIRGERASLLLYGAARRG
ncbi:hypothetical protein NFI95_15255 [Acetobacteraceae bacterium KSS8]|uniref:Uncharacterized protein n=1 Tax=Endosaccharibacter trunci TaxID=2812733 RepID=A0ABT1WA97_9PROT|nr:hypothetical protein [Acetobacteraceae bacterium KSS8]